MNLFLFQVWCDWLIGNNGTWFPVVSDEPFSHLAALATHFERLKANLRPILSQFRTEDEAKKSADPTKFELIKLEEDGLLCGFDPWFRGLEWETYRR